MTVVEREKPLPSRDEVREILKREITIEPRMKIVDLMGAWNRIVAEDIHSERSLPAGYTYREDGIAIDFAKLAELQAKPYLVEKMDYIHANQGWAMEGEFNTVIPLVNAQVEEHSAQVLTWPKAEGEYVNAPGSIMAEGELLVPKNTVINGQIMGLLAMGGIQGVPVYSRPRIVFIPTGDELIAWQEDEVKPGENVESNSVMVYGFAEKYRCKLEVMPIVPDDGDALEDALHYAKEIGDLVIISAGTSKGKKDITNRILAEEGDLIVEEVGCDPGRYLTVSKIKNTPILSLPGSPKGVQLTLGFYLPTIINKYYNQPAKQQNFLEVTADFAYSRQDDLDACLELIIMGEEDNYLGQIISGRNLTKGEALKTRRGIYYLKRGENIVPGDKLTVELLD